MNMLFDKNKFFKGKVALITGGARGIGKETATLFARKGSNVVICSRTETELKSTKKSIEKFHIKILAVRSDISKPEDVDKIITKTINRFGKINFLVNNAAISSFKTLDKTSKQEIDSTLDINLKGLIHLTRKALPYIDKKYGRIINISSDLGKKGMPGFSVYSATKFGVIGFTQAIAGELEPGIKAFVVCPKGTNTKMYWKNFPKSRNIFLHSPKKVAKAILETCSPTFRKESGSLIDV